MIVSTSLPHCRLFPFLPESLQINRRCIHLSLVSNRRDSQLFNPVNNLLNSLPGGRLNSQSPKLMRLPKVSKPLCLLRA